MNRDNQPKLPEEVEKRFDEEFFPRGNKHCGFEECEYPAQDRCFHATEDDTKSFIASLLSQAEERGKIAERANTLLVSVPYLRKLKLTEKQIQDWLLLLSPDKLANSNKLCKCGGILKHRVDKILGGENWYCSDCGTEESKSAKPLSPVITPEEVSHFRSNDPNYDPDAGDR